MESTLKNEKIKVQNRIKDCINTEYGFHDGLPAINLGPCGPFAKLFYQEYNKRFEEKAIICFVIAKTSGDCVHCCIRFHDGNFFDGGNGFVLKEEVEEWLITHNFYLEEMFNYNEEQLEKERIALTGNTNFAPPTAILELK